jgi:transposase
MTYSIDLRNKLLAIKNRDNLTYKEAAASFEVGVNSLIRWNKKLEPQSTRSKPATKIKDDVLLEDVKNYPDAYLRERAERLNASASGIYDALKRLGISCKKKHFRIPKPITPNAKPFKNA